MLIGHHSASSIRALAHPMRAGVPALV